MAKIREISLARQDALAEVEAIVPSAGTYVREFSDLWNRLLPLALHAHRSFHGEFAGAGPVDFLEGLTLYSLIREHRPDSVLEAGFAAGVSSCLIAHALRNNGHGTLDTVDIKDNGEVVSEFYLLADEGIIRPFFGDAVEFAGTSSADYALTFSDALHSYDFNRKLAAVLCQRFPEAIHCYHEWSLSPLASPSDARYVSLRQNLGTCGERQAFEETFRDGYVHRGVASSSGLGVIIPKHLR